MTGAGPSRLRWWVCFSGALHLAMIVTLLVAPTSTARRDLPVPVYTVDLVPGPLQAPPPQPAKPAPRQPEPAPVETLPSPEDDEIGEVLVEPVVPEPPKTVKPPPPPKEKVKKPSEPKVKKAPPKKKKVVKPRKKPVKPKKVVKRKKPVKPKKVAAKKSKAPKKKRPVKVAKTSTKPKRKASQAVERVRQRRIEDALAIARERAKLRQKIGVGKGPGAGGSGPGTGSGGLLKGREFVVYLNEMRDIFKERWTWIGKRRDLEATVSFGVRADGEIFGLKLLEPSGDAAYDESVVRAVKRASPLPRPPARYARDFTEVEFKFVPDSEG